MSINFRRETRVCRWAPAARNLRMPAVTDGNGRMRRECARIHRFWKYAPVMFGAQFNHFFFDQFLVPMREPHPISPKCLPHRGQFGKNGVTRYTARLVLSGKW